MGFSGSVPFKFEHKVPRNTTARKIGYGVILSYDNADVIETPGHNQFSSLSNTAAVVIFPNLCQW